MADFSRLNEIIKQMTVNVLKAEKPSNIVFGTVLNTSPLEISVEQKMTLTSAQLVLSRNVTKHEIEVEFIPEEWFTEKETCSVAHRHQIKGRKKLTLHNELKNGEKVILVRAWGGQKYVVMDRVGK